MIDGEEKALDSAYFAQLAQLYAVLVEALVAADGDEHAAMGRFRKGLNVARDARAIALELLKEHGQ